MLQTLLVILIVLAAALSAAWRLVGVGTRLRTVESILRHLPAGGVPARLLQRLAQRQRGALVSGGCAACSARDTHGPGHP
jgi:hypothetical protein